MLRPTKVQLVSIFSLLISGIMLSLSAWMVFSIDVITKWELVLPAGSDLPPSQIKEKNKIHVGDEIIVKSEYTKVRDVTGISERSLDCKNKDGIFLRYPLNKAKANRAPRNGGTGIEVIMPKVPDLPTQCKIAVSIPYEAIKIGNFVVRYVNESNETKEFTLYPERTSVSEDVSQQTNTTQVQVLSESNPGSAETSSSSNNTTSTTSTQRDISQEPQTNNPDPEQNQPEPSKPGLLSQILNPIVRLLQ